MLGPLSDRHPSFYARGEVAELPGWIAFDRQILRFDAFFREALQEVRAAPFLVREVRRRLRGISLDVPGVSGR